MELYTKEAPQTYTYRKTSTLSSINLSINSLGSIFPPAKQTFVNFFFFKSNSRKNKV